MVELHERRSVAVAANASFDPRGTPEKIAIVGMSCRLPGDVRNPVDFWNLCARARSGWSEVPAHRFSPEAYYHPNPGRKGTHNAQGGHFLSDNVALFDAPFFNITAAEATAMDPQQRLLLEGTYEAFENAGIARSETVGQNIGVFVGGYGADYQLLGHKDTETVPMYFATGTCKGLMSNRISYYFDLRGPSFTVDTACSSSLVALHLACQSLRTGESEAAVVGGVHLNLTPDSFASMSSQSLFSETGKSYAFDHRGTGGYGRGEGVGCLILKRLSDAIKANDRIRAVIVNSGTNQDGRTNGITLPNGAAQEDLIRSVYQDAGIDPSQVGFVEAHGTGTKVGDPIEARALAAVLCQGRSTNDPLFVGSVKSNIGHLEAASGVVSVIKAAMMLERGFILPNYDFQQLPRGIPDSMNIKVPMSQTPWPANKRYISINNFGFGGSNAHVVLEKGYRPTTPVEVAADTPGPDQNEPRRLFVISGHDEAAARASMESLVVYLERKPEAFEINMPRNLAYTLGERRSRMAWRIALTATTSSDLARQLLNPKLRPVRSKEPTTVAFIFTGQGAQWQCMGRELLETYPVFSNTFHTTDAIVARLGADFSLVEELLKDSQTTQINEPHISQPICTAIQIALVDLLASWNIKPSAVTGHSSGEIASAYAVQAMTLEECMAIAYHRGRTTRLLVENTKLPAGAMLAVGAGPDELRDMMSMIRDGRIGIACVNSPNSVTISGDKSGISQLQHRLEEKGIFNRQLRVNVAYHSYHMQMVAEDYYNSIAHIVPRPGCDSVRFHSSLHGHQVGTQELTAEYWVQNLTSTVHFSDSLADLCAYDATTQGTQLIKARTTVLLEVGPHAALEGPIKQTVSAGFAAGSLVYASMLRRNQDANETAQRAAGELFTRGVSINMAAINRPIPGTSIPQVLTDMPPYPFRHDTTYWHNSRISRKYLSSAKPARSEIIGTLADYSNDVAPEWRHVFQLDDVPWLRNHEMQGMVTYPMSAFVAMGIEAILQHQKLDYSRLAENAFPPTVELRNLVCQRPLVLKEDKEVELITKLSPCMLGLHTASERWYEFAVSSWTEQDGYTHHCRGQVSVFSLTETAKIPRSSPLDFPQGKPSAAESRSLCKESQRHCPIDPKDMYGALSATGLRYGEPFQALQEISTSGDNGQTTAKLVVPNTACLMPNSYEGAYAVHPIILESAFQSVWPLLGAGTYDMERLYMVSSLEHLLIRCGVSAVAGSTMCVRATSSLASGPRTSSPSDKQHQRLELLQDGFSVQLTPSDRDDQDWISMQGLKVLPVHNAGDLANDDSCRGLCYKTEWRALSEEPLINSATTSISNHDTRSDDSRQSSFVILEKVTIIYRQESQFDLAFKLSKALEFETGTPAELEAFETDCEISSAPAGFVIVIAEIGQTLLTSLSMRNFHRMKEIILAAKGLLWVCQSAIDNLEDPNVHLVTGLARSLRAETDQSFVVLDLNPAVANPNGNVQEHGSISHIVNVFTRCFSDPAESTSPQPSIDMEYRVRDGQLQVPRVTYDENLDRFVRSEAHGEEVIKMQPYIAKNMVLRPPLKMRMGVAGSLDSLYFIPDPMLSTPLGNNEVEIEIRATGVNNKDLMQVMGQELGVTIGMECAGIITRRGNKVRSPSIGERVCASFPAGAYSQFTRCPYTSVARIPENISFATAATIPIAYCTAYYSLFDVGRLSKNDTVMIHAGASDVGLAAIQLASYIGAEIYVTVRDESQRKFLMEEFTVKLPGTHIFLTHTNSFEPALKGRADVILNSPTVSGDLLRDTWNCIAPFGRFIETGKRDIRADLLLPMRQFERNATFASVDLAIIASEKPRLMQRLLSDVFAMIRNGIITPFAGGCVKPISEIVQAFKLLQSADVIGKIAVLHRGDDQVKAAIPRLSSSLLHADATYIIIGGTGGLGREITRWMISKGARNIVLLSRSGSTPGKVMELIQQAHGLGAEVLVRQCDVTDRSQVRQCLQDLVRANKPPVRGLIQGAMVFENTLFENLEYSRWQNVIAPKLAGTWNFHHELQDGNHSLDFFIMMSSISGIIGSRGQAPYSAANAFLDAFSAFRQAQGMPSATVDIAPVLDAGRLSEDGLGDRKIFSERFASDAISQVEVMALLGSVIAGVIPTGQHQCLTGLHLTSDNLQFRFWARDPRFQSILREAEVSRGAEAASTSELECLDSLIKHAQGDDDSQVVTIVYTVLAAKIAAILMIPVEDIHPSSSVVTCGLDSLAAVEFRNWITRELHAQLQILEIITSSNLEELSKLVLAKRK